MLENATISHVRLIHVLIGLIIMMTMFVIHIDGDRGGDGHADGDGDGHADVDGDGDGDVQCTFIFRNIVWKLHHLFWT